MPEPKSDEQYSYVDHDGRLWVNPKVLLHDPKVKEMMRRMGKVNDRYRNQPGITFLQPPKSKA